jgi:hypothetical protein
MPPNEQEDGKGAKGVFYREGARVTGSIKAGLHAVGLGKGAVRSEIGQSVKPRRMATILGKLEAGYWSASLI